ncbi:AAA family ATPase [Escherichia coli]|uniref:AAA family ATPase n=1 Tax=Escherichia coli TaxID=562 RepID=UPI00049F557B|nr:AAA family ATPase [Escherichia coli]KDG64860.1 hypothetical protein AE10_05108 [Escherichia coli UCI 51]
MAEKNKKTITGQVLNSIKINKLKCINGLNEIIFKPHALTAILGPNGSGKSTILHAIGTTAAWRLQIVVWQNMSFQSNHPE